jgi:endonuclease YncB( thermonuclease family)
MLFGRGVRTLTIVIFTYLACSLAQGADLSGVPRIVDGDTLAIGSTKVRLEGIDAPETDQQKHRGRDAPRTT